MKSHSQRNYLKGDLYGRSSPERENGEFWGTNLSKRGSHEHPDKDRKHNDYVSNVMALMIFLIMSENCTFDKI